jgi:uncharacterized membrane protein
MAQDKYSFIVVKYVGRDTAGWALNFLHNLEKEKVIKYKDAVAVTKTDKGKIHLQQTKDATPWKGLTGGTTIGVLFALLLGPAGWIAAGAAAGTALALFDRGIKDKLVKEVGENLDTTESLLCVLVESANWAELKERFQNNGFRGELLIHEMADAHIEALELVQASPDVPEEVPFDLDVPKSAV